MVFSYRFSDKDFGNEGMRLLQSFLSIGMTVIFVYYSIVANNYYLILFLITDECELKTMLLSIITRMERRDSFSCFSPHIDRESRK